MTPLRASTCALLGLAAFLPLALPGAGPPLSPHPPGLPRPVPPEQAKKTFRVAEGLQIQLLAHEPMVRQPVSITFDGRGRLWVLQCLQYPTPRGLRPVGVDQYLRTTYDRVPAPPPRG